MLQPSREHAPPGLHKQLRHEMRPSPRQHCRCTPERSGRLTPTQAGVCKRSRGCGLFVLLLQNLRSGACWLHFARLRPAVRDSCLEQRCLKSVEFRQSGRWHRLPESPRSETPNTLSTITTGAVSPTSVTCTLSEGSWGGAAAAAT
eukprot:3935201-Rhodomonas_salina.2